MKNLLRTHEAPRYFYRAGMEGTGSYEQIRTFKDVGLRGNQRVGTVFIFANDKGLDAVCAEFPNVTRVSVRSAYAPELVRHGLQVLTLAEFKRRSAHQQSTTKENPL